MDDIPALSNEEQLLIFELVKKGMPIDDALAQARERSFGRVAPKSAAPKPKPAAAKSTGSAEKGLLALVKDKINSKVQAATGACSSCGKQENGGVSRACRVCGTTYCGACKVKYMVKSADTRQAKKRRWICVDEACLNKDPDRVAPPLASAEATSSGKARHGSAVSARAKRRSAALAGAAALAATSCAVCQTTVYALEQVIGAKGTLFHKKCFNCSSCARSLAGVPYEFVGRKAFCNPPGRGAGSCLSKAQDITQEVTKGTVAGSIESADYTHVDVAAMIETLGAELERAIDGMVPRCETCGCTFQPTSTVIIMGPVKKHKECMQTGKPMFKRDMTPKQAARFVDDLLTIRVFCNGKWFSYLFVPSGDPTGDDAEIELEFVFDPKSHAPSERPCPQLGEGEAPEFDFMDPRAEYKPFQSPEVDLEEGTVTGFLVMEKWGLRHEVIANFAYDGVTVSAVSCVLSISVPDETKPGADQQEPVPNTAAAFNAAKSMFASAVASASPSAPSSSSSTTTATKAAATTTTTTTTSPPARPAGPAPPPPVQAAATTTKKPSGPAPPPPRPAAAPAAARAPPPPPPAASAATAAAAAPTAKLPAPAEVPSADQSEDEDAGAPAPAAGMATPKRTKRKTFKGAPPPPPEAPKQVEEDVPAESAADEAEPEPVSTAQPAAVDTTDDTATAAPADEGEAASEAKTDEGEAASEAKTGDGDDSAAAPVAPGRGKRRKQFKS